MNCKKCGAQLLPSDKFCSVCGQAQGDNSPPVTTAPPPPATPMESPAPANAFVPVEQPATQPLPVQPEGSYAYPQQTKKRNRTVAIVAIVLVLAILAAGAFLGFQWLKNRVGGSSNSTDSHYLILTNQKMQTTGVRLDSGKVIAFDEAVITHELEFSEDGSTALLVGEDSRRNKPIAYVITKNDVHILDHQINNSRISWDGNYIYYFTDYDYKTSSSSLYQFTTATQKSVLISHNALVDYNFYSMLNTTLSPDGKSIAYIEGDINRPASNEYYLFQGNEKSTKLSSMPLAISNDGKTGVYVDFDLERLSYESPNEQVILSKEFSAESDATSRIYVNRDLTQVLFHEYYSDEYYFFEAGSKPVPLGVDGLFPITHSPTDGTLYTDEYYHSADYYPQFSNTLLISDLRDSFYYNYWEDSILSINTKNRTQTLGEIESLEQVQVVGDTVYFIEYGNLCKFTRSEDRRAKTIASDVTSFVISNDGSSIYILESTTDNRSRLSHLSKKDNYKVDTLISKDVISLFSDGKNTCYYILGKDFSVHAVQGDGKSSQIGVTSLQEDIFITDYTSSYYSPFLKEAYYSSFVKNGVFYFFSDEGGLFSSVDGKTPKLVLDTIYVASFNHATAYDYPTFKAYQKEMSAGDDGDDWKWGDDESSAEDWDWGDESSAEDWDWGDESSEEEDSVRKDADPATSEATAAISEEGTIAFVFYNWDEIEAEEFVQALPASHKNVAFTCSSFFIEESEDNVITEDDLSEIMETSPDIVVVLDHENEASLSKEAISLLVDGTRQYQKTELDTFQALADLFLSTFVDAFV